MDKGEKYLAFSVTALLTAFVLFVAYLITISNKRSVPAAPGYDGALLELKEVDVFQLANGTNLKLFVKDESTGLYKEMEERNKQD